MTSYHHLYDSAHWRRLRHYQLTIEPLCYYCARLGYVTNATIADHIRPHKGDTGLFYDASNLQSLCKTCHDKAKAIAERAGVEIGSNLSGFPVDPSHHWHK